MDQNLKKEKERDSILQMMMDGEVSRARESLEEYRHVYGADEFYYHLLADSYLDQSKFQTAVKILQEARYHGINSFLLNQSMAEAWYGLEEFQKALDELNQIDDSLPEWTPVIFDLRALCYEGLKDYKNAVACYEDYLMEEEDPEILVRAAIDYLYLNKEERAFEYFDRYFFMTPQAYEDDIYYPLLKLGYEDLARRFLRRMLKNEEAIDELIITTSFMIHDQKYEAINYLQDRTRIDPTAGRLSILANLYNQTGQNDMEMKTFRKVLNAPIQDDIQFPEEDLKHRLNALEQLGYTKNTIKKYLAKYTDMFAKDLASRIRLMDFALEHDCYSELFNLMEMDIEWDKMGKGLMEAYEKHYVEYLKKTEQYERLYDYMRQMDYHYNDPTFMFEYAMTACRVGHLSEGIRIFNDLLPDGFSAIMLMKIYDLYGMDREERQLKKYMEDIVQTVSPLDIEGYQEYLRFLHHHG